MGEELDNIIIEKLGTIPFGNSSLYRMKIIESLFTHSENIYRQYQHRKYEHGKHIRLRSNNLCHTIYSSIKLICDRNPLSFPFLLSYFYDKDIFKVIKDELINNLIRVENEDPQLRLNINRYLQSDQDIRARNDFLYRMYSDSQVVYKKIVSTIIEDKVKDYVAGLTSKEIQHIYRKVSDKIKNFDRDKNKGVFNKLCQSKQLNFQSVRKKAQFG